MKNIKQTKKSLAILLAVLMLLGTGSMLTMSGPFSDVSYKAWYREPVTYMTEHGYINGTGDGKLSPYLTATNAMFMTALSRIDGVDTDDRGSFKPDWYVTCGQAAGILYSSLNGHTLPAGDIMEWAVSSGLFHDTSRLNPDEPMSRAEMAYMLCRYIEIRDGQD